MKKSGVGHFEQYRSKSQSGMCFPRPPGAWCEARERFRMVRIRNITLHLQRFLCNFSGHVWDLQLDERWSSIRIEWARPFPGYSIIRHFKMKCESAKMVCLICHQEFFPAGSNMMATLFSWKHCTTISTYLFKCVKSRLCNQCHMCVEERISNHMSADAWVFYHTSLFYLCAPMRMQHLCLRLCTSTAACLQKSNHVCANSSRLPHLCTPSNRAWGIINIWC